MSDIASRCHNLRMSDIDVSILVIGMSDIMSIFHNLDKECQTLKCVFFIF